MYITIKSFTILLFLFNNPPILLENVYMACCNDVKTYPSPNAFALEQDLTVIDGIKWPTKWFYKGDFYNGSKIISIGYSPYIIKNGLILPNDRVIPKSRTNSLDCELCIPTINPYECKRN